ADAAADRPRPAAGPADVPGQRGPAARGRRAGAGRVAAAGRAPVRRGDPARVGRALLTAIWRRGRRPGDGRRRCRGSTDTTPVSADPSALPDAAWTPAASTANWETRPSRTGQF